MILESCGGGEGEQTGTPFADQVSTASLALTYDLLKLNTANAFGRSAIGQSKVFYYLFTGDLTYAHCTSDHRTHRPLAQAGRL
jgi:hypothetical protein